MISLVYISNRRFTLKWKPFPEHYLNNLEIDEFLGWIVQMYQSMTDRHKHMLSREIYFDGRVVRTLLSIYAHHCSHNSDEAVCFIYTLKWRGEKTKRIIRLTLLLLCCAERTVVCISRAFAAVCEQSSHTTVSRFPVFCVCVWSTLFLPYYENSDTWVYTELSVHDTPIEIDFYA